MIIFDTIAINFESSKIKTDFHITSSSEPRIDTAGNSKILAGQTNLITGTVNLSKVTINGDVTIENIHIDREANFPNRDYLKEKKRHRTIEHDNLALDLKHATIRGTLQLSNINTSDELAGIGGAVDLSFCKCGPLFLDDLIFDRFQSADPFPFAPDGPYKAPPCGRLKIREFVYDSVSIDYQSIGTYTEPEFRVWERKVFEQNSGHFGGTKNVAFASAQPVPLVVQLPIATKTTEVAIKIEARNLPDANRLYDWFMLQSPSQIWGPNINLQCWTNAASVYQSMGRYEDANILLYWREYFYHMSLLKRPIELEVDNPEWNLWKSSKSPIDSRHTHYNLANWIFHWLLTPAGYGYNSTPALLWSVIFILFGTLMFEASHRQGLLIRSPADDPGGRATITEREHARTNGGSAQVVSPSVSHKLINSSDCHHEEWTTDDCEPASETDPCCAPPANPISPAIRGPKGDPGPPGPAGARGPPGPPGAAAIKIPSGNLQFKADDEPYPNFASFAYSIDVFIPLVDLSQGRFWLPGLKPKSEDTGRNSGTTETQELEPEPNLHTGFSLRSLALAAATTIVFVIVCVTSVVFIQIQRGNGILSNLIVLAAIGALVVYSFALYPDAIIANISTNLTLEAVWLWYWLQTIMGWYLTFIIGSAWAGILQRREISK